MGCICSKGAEEEDSKANAGNGRERRAPKAFPSVQLVAPVPSKKEELMVDVGCRPELVVPKLSVVGNVIVPLQEEEKKAKIVIRGHPQRLPTMDLGFGGERQSTQRVVGMPHGSEGELIASGWPQWLTSAAGEAIRGWLPRRADAFEKLDKIGQGTYSSVYKARDIENGKIVAMKKVRFVNMDPESVRFMAREIHILRKLDHPNIMKLEGIVTSRMSGSLYLVFEYMEHDLTGLAASPSINFTESQIKCFMQQLFRGLEHCHSRGVLHRDIKGSNLLINEKGCLKIGDFGLATFYTPDQNQALTSRVVTLWYRAPELLLGATNYGVGIDMWSAGCILAELFYGKPIMPGRTEVEQMHKIFKLCGSPSEEYWRKAKLPHTTSFKPQHCYKRCVADTFKSFPLPALALVDKLLSIEPGVRETAKSVLGSEFFRTLPLPCDPSALPKYPPSKELDAKIREQARRQRAEVVKGRAPESARGRGPRDHKTVPTPEFPQGHPKTSSTSYKYDIQEDAGSGFRIEPPRGGRGGGGGGAKQGTFSHSATMVHPSVVGSTLNRNATTRNDAELRNQRSSSHLPPTSIADLPGSCLKKEERTASKDDRNSSTSSSMGQANVPRKNRIHYSGPLMPSGGNIDDMLKEHERQIQEAVRKSRLEKSATKTNFVAYAPTHNHRRYRG